MDIMIDLETLGTRPDALIIQIGAVLFEPKDGGRIHNECTFDAHCKVQDDGGTVDHDTLCFWLAERSAVSMSEALSEKAYRTKDALANLEAWPRNAVGEDWKAIEGVWANPADFDLPILRLAFHRFLGREAPWDRSATRCAKTLWTVTGKPVIDWTGLVAHDAADDALGQAMMVQKAFGLLTGRGS